MAALILLIILPLGVIGVQLLLDLHGAAGYSIYKLFLLFPPLVYCRMRGISVLGDVLKVRNWRRCLPAAIALGCGAVALFWSAYFLLGDLLLDKAMIAAKVARQSGITAATVLLVAPATIFVNSLLEEFFYRGIAFGLLVRRQRLSGYLLPAAAFTTQHVLFMYHWVAPLPLAMAIAGLFVFALLLQRIYEKADSIVAPWVVHVLGDVAMMGVAVAIL